MNSPASDRRSQLEAAKWGNFRQPRPRLQQNQLRKREYVINNNNNNGIGDAQSRERIYRVLILDNKRTRRGTILIVH